MPSSRSHRTPRTTSPRPGRPASHVKTRSGSARTPVLQGELVPHNAAGRSGQSFPGSNSTKLHMFRDDRNSESEPAREELRGVGKGRSTQSVGLAHLTIKTYVEGRAGTITRGSWFGKSRMSSEPHVSPLPLPPAPARRAPLPVGTPFPAACHAPAPHPCAFPSFWEAPRSPVLCTS